MWFQNRRAKYRKQEKQLQKVLPCPMVLTGSSNATMMNQSNNNTNMSSHHQAAALCNGVMRNLSYSSSNTQRSYPFHHHHHHQYLSTAGQSLMPLRQVAAQMSSNPIGTTASNSVGGSSPYEPMVTHFGASSFSIDTGTNNSSNLRQV